MAAPAEPDARIRAAEMLAAMPHPSVADLAELQEVGSHHDGLLAAQQVDVNGLVAEFKRARKHQRHAKGVDRMSPTG